MFLREYQILELTGETNENKATFLQIPCYPNRSHNGLQSFQALLLWREETLKRRKIKIQKASS